MSDVKRGTERTNKTTTQRYITASINVGYIAKMEGIVSVIVTAVDTAFPLRFIVICAV